MTDVSASVVRAAMSGLSVRQRVIADNIANVQTPGYLAGKVDFESSLRSALARGTGGTARAEVSRSTAPTRTDGNNVNLDTETMALIETNLRYQTMVEAMNAKFRLLRAATARF